MTLDSLLAQLEHVTPRGTRYMATCPAHVDRSPSLQVTPGDKGILLKCWSGCTAEEICQALGLTVSDLFFNNGRPAHLGHRHTPTPPRVDRFALAFRYELAALDLRIRAEGIIEAGKRLDVEGLSEDQLDGALAHVAHAHTDSARAALFEGVADDLRMKECMERDHEQLRRIA